MRAAVLMLLALPGLVQTQPRVSVAGTVRDTSGTPVPLAQINVGTTRTHSDSAGRYTLANLPVGRNTISVRRLGFEPLFADIDLVAGSTASLDLVLASVPMRLPTLTAESEALERVRLADFYRHREIGNGFFFNRRELEDKKAARLSDVLRRLPGVRISSDRSGRASLRMSRSANCPPDFWIDGQRAPFLNVDDLPLRDIEALEVYRGASGVPPEFNNRLGNPACGAVIIWTRLPG